MMPGRAERPDVVLSPLLTHAHNVREHKQTTRRIALAVAIILIGGVSLVSFKFSRNHTSNILRTENFRKVGDTPQRIGSYEAQHQLASQDVLQFLNTTGLSTGGKLAQLASDTSGSGVLGNLASFSSFVVFTVGAGKPQRRGDSEPFLSVSPASLLPVDAVNAAAELVEAALGRRLFPLKLTAVDFDKLRAGPPYVVYEVSSGRVWLDRSVFVDMFRPGYMQQLMASTAEQLGKQLSLVLKAGISPSSVEALLAVLATAFGLAVSSAFSTMVPLWFCIACPVVLGLAAPLIINLALGGMASVICRQLALPDQECLDLWMGALLVGFVLTMASAVPIFKVCKMYQCEHQSPPAPTRA